MSAIVGFANATPGLESPGYCTTITPNDSVDLINASRGLSWGVDGTIAYQRFNSMTNAIESDSIAAGDLATGICHPIRGITRILATGTTASQIKVWW